MRCEVAFPLLRVSAEMLERFIAAIFVIEAVDIQVHRSASLAKCKQRFCRQRQTVVAAPHEDATKQIWLVA